MKRIPKFKTDHPLSHKAEGHLFNDARQKFTKTQRSRSYTSWEPPTGTEAREGKRILGVRHVNDGFAHQEHD